MGRKKTVQKPERILSMYERLQRGEILYAAEEMEHYRIDRRTLQRDIETIRNFLNDQERGAKSGGQILYDTRQKGYYLKGYLDLRFTGPEALAVGKILLESHSLIREEIDTVLEKLLLFCSQRAELKHFFRRETYQEPHHGRKLLEMLWTISEGLRGQFYLQAEYEWKISRGG